MAGGPGSFAERWFAFLDLRDAKPKEMGREVVASLTITVLGIPQGVAYAMIAGLPPAMGLYASCVPTIIGSIFRSSRHVVSGPTNALSLLVGTAGAAAAGLDPVPTALLIAFLVGVIQVGANVGDESPCWGQLGMRGPTMPALMKIGTCSSTHAA